MTIQQDSLTLNVDYQEFDQEDERTIPIASNFVIQNTDATARTVQVSLEGLPTGYSAEPVPNVTITAGSTQTVPFRINVTHRQNPGTANIGNIIIKETNNTEIDRAALVQNTASMLVIKEIKAEYVDEDGDERDEDFDADGNTSEFSLDRKVRPGSEITLEIEIENRFDDEDYEESEIENMELTVDADDSDLFPRDFEEEYELDDLPAKEKKTVTVVWKIPEDADVGDYKIELTLEGEDGKDVKYKIEKKIRLDVRRARDDLRVTKALVSPSSLTACDESFTLDVELKNYGTDNQEHAGFAIFNSELKINENIPDIELDEFDDGDDTWRRTFTFNLPKNVEAKTYRLDLIPFIDRTKEINEEFLNLVVKKCPERTSPEKPIVPENKENENKTQRETATIAATARGNGETRTEETNTKITETSSGVIRSVEEPYTTEDVLVAMLIVGIIIIIVLIALFIILLVKK
ncbi:hypothetical protein J4421_00430 [Candidatus Woesearchaeota archaeon]|nr:hypothetical protein [Candidatus Woesearchaeota archaeon]